MRLDEVGDVKGHLVHLGVAATGLANMPRWVPRSGTTRGNSLEGLDLPKHLDVFGGNKVDGNTDLVS